MMSVFRFLSVTLMSIVLLQHCNPTVENSQSSEGDWLLPRDMIFDGGPGKDGIPALASPRFTTPEKATYLRDNDLVLGLVVGDDVRAYPHPILDWHEIVNDEVGGSPLAITYCPLTGSGIGWKRNFSGDVTTFGVSGLLYNSNLIPYDRLTNSNWSQMRLQCVNGSLKGQLIETFPLIETTWKTWKGMYPQTSVLSSSTGYSRPYGTYPYGNFKSDPGLIFPVTHDDTRLHRKARVLGIIIGDQAKAYPVGEFPDSIATIHDSLNNIPIVIVGSRELNLAVAFERRMEDATVLTFSPLQNRLPLVLVDSEGTRWDAFGRAVDGPRKGMTLRPTRSFIAYWFAWGAFHSTSELYRR
jgi:hypothetical protein